MESLVESERTSYFILMKHREQKITGGEKRGAVGETVCHGGGWRDKKTHTITHTHTHSDRGLPCVCLRAETAER